MMNQAHPALGAAWNETRTRALRDIVALCKPRVVGMVLLTTAAGFYLGSVGRPDGVALVQTLLGTGLAAAGALALNQYLERDLDARMQRTRFRPLPAGRISPGDALGLGAALTLAGVLLLAIRLNVTSAFVTGATAGIYLFGYTPLKRRTALCSVVGAVPGALPPVTGWVAARGELGPGAGVLFAILYLWQLPHSLAIAQLYAEDYARAGFRLLPVVDPDGRSTERQIVSNCSALLPIGLMPTFLGLAGSVYFVCALLLGGGFLWSGLSLVRVRSRAAQRRVLVASLVYLPLLLAAMVADKVSF